MCTALSITPPDVPQPILPVPIAGQVYSLASFLPQMFLQHDVPSGSSTCINPCVPTSAHRHISAIQPTWRFKLPHLCSFAIILLRPQLQFFKAVHGKELSQCPFDLPGHICSVELKTFQVVELLQSFRKIQRPVMRIKFKLPKTLWEAPWHLCSRKSFIHQCLQTLHLANIVNEVPAPKAALPDAQ